MLVENLNFQGDDVIRPDVPKSFDDIKTNNKEDEAFRVYKAEESPQRVVDH